jgi:hypothetical protein
MGSNCLECCFSSSTNHFGSLAWPTTPHPAAQRPAAPTRDGAAGHRPCPWPRAAPAGVYRARACVRGGYLVASCESGIAMH